MLKVIVITLTVLQLQRRDQLWADAQVARIVTESSRSREDPQPYLD
jgi:hypothetical protein